MTFSSHLKRTFVSFPIADHSFSCDLLSNIKQQMLTWASRFSICCFLDNQAYGLSPHSFECLLAAGAVDHIQADAGDAFGQLKEFVSTHSDWLFGHFAYDLAKETEPPRTPHTDTHSRDPFVKDPFRPSMPDPIGFPDLYFFVPEIVIELGPGEIRIGVFGDGHETVWRQILQAVPPPSDREPPAGKTPGARPISGGWIDGYRVFV